VLCVLSTSVSRAKTAELTQMPFGDRLVRARRTMYQMKVHTVWCYLANTIERSVRCGNAALYQLTLTTFTFVHFFCYLIFLNLES